MLIGKPIITDKQMSLPIHFVFRRREISLSIIGKRLVNKTGEQEKLRLNHRKPSATSCNVTFVRKLALVFSGIGSFQFQLNEYKIVWTNRWPHFKASSTRIRIILKTEVLIISPFSKNRRPHVPYIWIVFARPHEHAKTMEIPIACSQGMRCMMYGIILFGNLRFPRFTQKR